MDTSVSSLSGIRPRSSVCFANQLRELTEELQLLRTRTELVDASTRFASGLPGTPEEKAAVLLHTLCCLSGECLSRLTDTLDQIAKSQEQHLETLAILARYGALEAFDGLAMARRSLATAGLPGARIEAGAMSHVRCALELHLRAVVETVQSVIEATRALEAGGPESGVQSKAGSLCGSVSFADEDDDPFEDGSRIVGVTRHRITAAERATVG